MQGVRGYLAWRLILKQPRVHRLMTRLLAPDRDVEITLFGAKLVVNRRREFGYHRAFRHAQRSPVLAWESASLMSLISLLQPGDTFIDVGANVGLYSAQVARLHPLLGDLRIYAFEANPMTAERLRRTLQGTAAVVFSIALSDRDETLEFVDGAVSFVFGVKGHQGPFQISGKSVPISAKRLDSFPIAGNRMVIKIDVEGHERAVLEGARAFFEQRRVKAVYLDGFEDPAIPEWLRNRGFRLHNARSGVLDGAATSILAIHDSLDALVSTQMSAFANAKQGA